MRKAIAALTLFAPVSAHAHGPASAYILLWWYLALVVVLLGFAVFGRSTFKRKLYSAGGFILLGMFAMLTIGNIHADLNSWQSNAIAVALGIAPLVGLSVGFWLGRAK